MLNLAGHCVRHKEEMACSSSMDTHTRKEKKRTSAAYICRCSKTSTDLESIDEIRSVMMDRGK